MSNPCLYLPWCTQFLDEVPEWTIRWNGVQQRIEMPQGTYSHIDYGRVCGEEWIPWGEAVAFEVRRILNLIPAAFQIQFGEDLLENGCPGYVFFTTADQFEIVSMNETMRCLLGLSTAVIGQNIPQGAFASTEDLCFAKCLKDCQSLSIDSFGEKKSRGKRWTDDSGRSYFSGLPPEDLGFNITLDGIPAECTYNYFQKRPQGRTQNYTWEDFWCHWQCGNPLLIRFRDNPDAEGCYYPDSVVDYYDGSYAPRRDQKNYDKSWKIRFRGALKGCYYEPEGPGQEPQ